MERELAAAADVDKAVLATAILELDSDSVAANTVLEHVRHKGRWYTEQALAWKDGADRVAGLMGEAWQLEIPAYRDASKNPTAMKLYGLDATVVYANGLYLHGGMAAEKLERILRESLRAMAFSSAVRGGPMQVPTLQRPRTLILIHGREHFPDAVKEAVANSGLRERQGDQVVRLDLQSFEDSRGWRTANAMSEADYQSLVLWDTYEDWLANDVQPCFLAGHLNWLSLNFYGTSMTEVMFSQRTAARNATSGAEVILDEALWKCVGNSFYGCQTWMRERMKAGHIYPFADAIVEELGQVRNESLLKATLVVDYLQQSGDFGSLMSNTARKIRKISTISKAMGRSLADFEREWAEWMLAESAGLGLVQRMTALADSATAGDASELIEGDSGHSADALEALEYLRQLRAQAYVERNIWYEKVSLYSELSENAFMHAQYLEWNPKQARKWPDAHEEYYGRKGFSPQGAWAGRQSLIHGITGPKEVIDAWMATFYHRLPLLHPGMFGIGFGATKGFTVMDTNSLTAPYHGEVWSVWPVDGAKGVGRRFQPEKPNPIPGGKQEKWGFPITLHEFSGPRKSYRPIEMTLHFGRDRHGKVVDCHFITPYTNFNPRYSPEGAYALIPKSALKSKQPYTVVASCEKTGKELVWTFVTGSN